MLQFIPQLCNVVSSNDPKEDVDAEGDQEEDDKHNRKNKPQRVVVVSTFWCRVHRYEILYSRLYFNLRIVFTESQFGTVKEFHELKIRSKYESFFISN